MGIYTDKNSFTIFFAIGMVFIVGTLLAAIDSSLKEKIKQIKFLKNNRIFFMQLE